MQIVQSLLVLFALFSVLPRAWCFSRAPGGGFTSLRRAIHHSSSSTKIARHPYLADVSSSARETLLHSTEDGDNQSEIAALEERLRQLKSEEGGSSTETETIEPVPLPSPSTVANEGDDDLPDDMERLEGESEDSVMFSERWKEAKEGYVEKSYVEKMDFDVGSIGKIGLGIALVILLGFFSQVPVGEESLQRYQDVKGGTSRIDLGDLNLEGN